MENIMDEIPKELVSNLANILKKETLKFIIENTEEEYISPLMNLVLSSHITSLTAAMQIVAEGNEFAEKKIKEFLAGLYKFIEEHCKLEIYEINKNA